MMEERRRFVRLDTRANVSFTVLATGASVQAVSKNMGGGGMCFFSDKTLTPGTCLQVSMILPGRDQPVRFTAEVVWSEPYEVIGKTERQRAVEVGVRFLDIAPDDQQKIMQHVVLSLKSTATTSPS